jgi:Uma2 family endonuclease
MSIANKYRITEQQYLQGELQSQIKHEFVQGEVFAMVGASSAHNWISLNVASTLRTHLKGKPCRRLKNEKRKNNQPHRCQSLMQFLHVLFHHTTSFN